MGPMRISVVPGGAWTTAGTGWITAMVLVGIVLFFSSGVRAGEGVPVKIYAPASPTSIPLILAAETLPGVEITIFTNHSQAHALFLKGEVQLLCTGLAVGVGFFRQGVPVRIISSHVAGLTWLVSDKAVSRLGDLKGDSLYLPFPGAPVEEVTRFLARAEGLIWKQDIAIHYMAFPGAAMLLQQGRIRSAVLPEPFVSLVLIRKREPEKSPSVQFRLPRAHQAAPGHFSSQEPQRRTGESKTQNPSGPSFHLLSYRAMWEKKTGDRHGYPQVGIFVHQAFAKNHGAVIHRFNNALDRAIREMKKDPDPAVKRAAAYMDFSAALLHQALQRTDFYLWQAEALKQGIHHYYQTIGTPLNETFDSFF